MVCNDGAQVGFITQLIFAADVAGEFAYKRAGNQIMTDKAFSVQMPLIHIKIFPFGSD